MEHTPLNMSVQQSNITFCTSSSLKRELDTALLGCGVEALACLGLGLDLAADANRSSSSSSSNNDKGALLVLAWLVGSGLDWLLGMFGNPYGR